MKILPADLGIISLYTFLFFFILELSPSESDIEDLPLKVNIEFLDGKMFFTIHNKLSLRDVKTLQKVDSFIKLQIIEPEQQRINGNPNNNSREPP